MQISVTGGEQARHVEAVARLDDAVGEPGIGPARTRHELRHHRADQRQAAAVRTPARMNGRAEGSSSSVSR